MAKAWPAVTTIEYDNSGGSLVDISQYVLDLSGIEVEQLLEETHSFGDSWEEHTPIGIAKVNQITIGGLFDDTASTGPNALFIRTSPDTPASSTRTLKVTFNSTPKSVSVETHLVKYTRSADRNGITKYEVVLQPTGATTEV